jgi:hypothetical protein
MKIGKIRKFRILRNQKSIYCFSLLQKTFDLLKDFRPIKNLQVITKHNENITKPRIGKMKIIDLEYTNPTNEIIVSTNG